MLEKVAQLGPYRLLTRISAGGTAEVYLAQVRAPDGRDRLVAIKRILSQFADEPDFATMLIDEARLVSQLIHTGIAQVLDLGRDKGELYLAMEYVAGKDLAAVGKRLRGLKARLDPVLACHVMAEVLDALDYAHAAVGLDGKPMALVHRDISPSNVIVSWDGEVKLIDFGIARATNRITKTQAGVLKGKYRYMSPEQASGKPVDGRSDLYSASIVIHELLIGEKLYAGDADFDIIEKVISGRVPKLRGSPGIPDELAAIVERGVLKDVARRWQTGHEFANRLRGWLDSVAGGRDLSQELLVFMQNVFAKEHAEEREHLAKLLASLPGERPRPQRPPPPPLQSADDVQASTILEAGVPPEVQAALARQKENAATEPEQRPVGRVTPKPAKPPPALESQKSAPAAPPTETGETQMLRIPDLTITETNPDNQVNRHRRKGGIAKLVIAAIAVAVVAAAATFILQGHARPVDAPKQPPVVEIEVVPQPVVEEAPSPAEEPTPEPEVKRAMPRPEPKKPAPVMPAPSAAAVAMGKLRVSAFPPGKLWLDGKETSHSTPVIDLEVSAGSHELWVVAPDGRKAEARVEVPAGGTVTKFVPYPK